jgi:hypothetical protein
MTAETKQLIDYLSGLGIDGVGHTGGSYLAHLASVYHLMESQACSPDVCRAGLFHSIYGTQLFQGFKIGLDRRPELRDAIGARAERLAYLNCAMDRATLDAAVERGDGPYRVTDRLTGDEVTLSREDFDDLCRVHLFDWLEQVPRSRHGWGYRRATYRRMAERLGPAPVAAYDRVFANEVAPPQNPAGEFVAEDNITAQRRAELIATIEAAPAALAEAVAGLSPEQLDARYRNWTVRQIVHHIADSHVNSYVRFKWALTEDRPLIKAYDEGRWVALADSHRGDILAPLSLLGGLHARWLLLLRSMSDEQFARCFRHPESGATLTLNAALCYYAWHGRHHTGQVRWLRKQRGW